jgi:hypothetical protein
MADDRFLSYEDDFCEETPPHCGDCKKRTIFWKYLKELSCVECGGNHITNSKTQKDWHCVKCGSTTLLHVEHVRGFITKPIYKGLILDDLKTVEYVGEDEIHDEFIKCGDCGTLHNFSTHEGVINMLSYREETNLRNDSGIL